MRNSKHFAQKTYNNIDREAAEAVYDVLFEICHASPTSNNKWLFVNYVTNDEWSEYVEYCFKGDSQSDWVGENILGHGGKFRITPNDWHMSCYTEDWNMYRQMIIDTVNPMLMEIRAAFLKRQWAAAFTPISTESEV